jgi:hypothetical protein
MSHLECGSTMEKFAAEEGHRVKKMGNAALVTFKFVTVWALPRPTLVRVRIAHVRSSIYVAQPTLGSQFSAVSPLSYPLVALLQL